jgi:hypothetical protein
MAVQKSDPSDGKLPLWEVWRTDDTGNSFLVRDGLSHSDTEQLVAQFTARGHKQTYCAEQHNAAEHDATCDCGGT